MGRPCNCGPCRAGCGPCYGPDDYDSLPASLTVEILGGMCDGSGTAMPCTPSPQTITKKCLSPSGPPCDQCYIRWDKDPDPTWVFNCGSLLQVNLQVVVKYNCRSADGWRSLSFDTLSIGSLDGTFGFNLGAGCDAFTWRPRTDPLLLNGEISVSPFSGGTYWWHIRVTE